MAADTSVRVEVDGLRQLGRDLRRLGDDLGDLKDANASVSQLVAADASRRAPHGKSGKLGGSVRGNRAAGRATVLAGGARVPYAGPVHYGWPAHHITGQPFVADAAQATEGEWLPLYQHEIDQAVAKVAGHTY